MSALARIRLVAVVLIAAIVVSPSLAFAADATWEHGTITLGDLAGGKEPTYVVTLQMPESTKLPATVSVPVPADTEIVWAGEIFGGDTNRDIVASKVETSAAGEAQIVKFTATQSRTVQVECSVAPGMIKPTGSSLQVDLWWDGTKVTGQTEIAVLVPSDTKAKTVPEGVKLGSMAAGAVYYRSYEKVADGERLELALELVPGDPNGTESTATPAATATAPAAQQPGGIDFGDRNTWVLVGLGALLVGAIVVLVLALKRRGSQ